MSRLADSPPLVAPASSLMQLAVVERQLVMQRLDYSALAAVMCTCRQLAVEALHLQSGKFVQTQTGFPSDIAQAVHFGPFEPSPMHASPLFRAHMPIELRLSGEDADDIPKLIAQLTPFKRFHELVLWDAGDEWTEERALQLVRSPVVQSVRMVWGFRPNSVWLDSLAVQRTILALPLLHKISCDFNRELNVTLDREALADARMLREATIELRVRDHRAFAPFAGVPLTHLVLLFVGSISDETPPCTTVLPTMTSLSLDVRSSSPKGDPTLAHLQAMLAGFPKIEVLRAENFSEPEIVLQACLALGSEKLPALRRVDLIGRAGVSADLYDRFLAQFPLVTSSAAKAMYV